MIRMLFVTAIFFVPISTNFARAGVVVNGSFEIATSGFAHNWDSIGSTLVTSLQGESHGVNSMAFGFGNLPPTGSISQTFDTIAGTKYFLTFDFGKYSNNQPLAVARLQADIFDGSGFGGAQILNQLVSDGTPTTGDPDSTDSPDVYSSFKFEFIASGSTSTIRFADSSDAQTPDGGFDAMLDNVDINAVPEPSSMVLLGLSMFTFCVRRRHIAN